jgi:hypothetical protein
MSGLTRDDIIRMAREAGFESNSLGLTYTSGLLPDLLERFAALVAAAEREVCAKLCDALKNPIDDPLAPVGQYESGGYITAEFLADAIRARGQQDNG